MKKYWIIAPYDSTDSGAFDAAWQWDRKNGTVAVGWRDIGNIESMTLEEYQKRYKETWPTGAPHDRDSFWAFWHEMSIGDVLLARKGTKEIIGKGEVTGPPYYDEQKGKERIGQSGSGFYANFLPVKWSDTSIRYPDAVFPIFTIWEIKEQQFQRFLAGPFSWIPIYQEILDKLLEYRNNQQFLINLLKEIGQKGVPMLILNDKDSNNESIPLSVIDPFTFFASFNRGIREDHRKEIIQSLKKELDLASPLPYDFLGIPVMNNQNSWFFPYSPQRQPDDIDRLWDLAEAARDGKVTQVLFDRCLQIKQVGLGKLTVGLFWVRPNQFRSLSIFS